MSQKLLTDKQISDAIGVFGIGLETEFGETGRLAAACILAISGAVEGGQIKRLSDHIQVWIKIRQRELLEEGDK